MKISELLDQHNVLPDIEVGSKQEAIGRLIDALSHQLDEVSLTNAREAVMERENIMSTGVGKGLAIPHGKAKGLDRSYASFARLKTPVDFGSIDDQPVSMIFLLIGPETQNSLHIKMLSRVSRLMNSSSFRERLMKCEDRESIIQVFRNEEDQFVRI